VCLEPNSPPWLGTPFTLRRRRTLVMLLMTSVLWLAGLMISCGGGGDSAPRPPRVYYVTIRPTGTTPVTNPMPVVLTVSVK
jgi:hypothetical protein